MRKCTKCYVEKREDDFYHRSCGRLIQPCRQCMSKRDRVLEEPLRTQHAQKQKARYLRNPTACNLISAAARRKKPKLYQAINERWLERNKERMRPVIHAYAAVRKAMQNGLLVRPANCSKCHSPGLIEAAHSDYSKPLDVTWLCRPCHRRWDAAQPKTL